ncbi:thioredoxin family protein [Roseibium sp. SCPC15]|uniref:thioredoxin family protein n=1 Tax=Roseibium sp. SCP15 TaxID=3141376 RepID=UPI00333CA130
MKKQKRSPRAQTRKVKHDNRIEAEAQADQGRRRFLRLTRNAVIGAALVGGSGYVFAQNVLSARHEHDLTRVGNGKPTIVQIHDPQCSMCRALQKETREALAMFEEGELDYVIANIRTQKGRSFANRYGVQHVTLLLFDEKGDLQDVLEGQRGSYQLRDAFRGLLSS